jgi:cold shock protein
VSEETGTVKFYRADKGFGFIVPDLGGKDIFVHASALRRAGLRDLREHDRVSFDSEPSPNGKGPQVTEIELVD